MTDVVPRPVPEITRGAVGPSSPPPARRGLVVQRCTGCGRAASRRATSAASCLGTRSRMGRVSGRGTILSFNVMHQVYHPGFAAEVPYAVVVVELDDGGPHALQRRRVPDRAAAVGLPVEVTFERRSAEVSLPQFRPRA